MNHECEIRINKILNIKLSFVYLLVKYSETLETQFHCLACLYLMFESVSTKVILLEIAPHFRTQLFCPFLFPFDQEMSLHWQFHLCSKALLFS